MSAEIAVDETEGEGKRKHSQFVDFGAISRCFRSFKNTLSSGGNPRINFNYDMTEGNPSLSRQWPPPIKSIGFINSVPYCEFSGNTKFTTV